MLLLERQSGSPVALPLVDWLPGSLGYATFAEGTELAEALELAGIRSLLVALGLDQAWSFELDEPTAADSERLRRGPAAVVVGSPSTTYKHATQALAVAAAVSSLVAFGVDRARGSTSAVVAHHVLSQLLLAGVFGVGVALLVVARRRALSPLPDVARTTGRLANGVEVAHLADGTIVVDDPFGTSCALPGPRQGGIVRAIAHVQEGVGSRRFQLYVNVPGSTPIFDMPDTWWSGEGAAGRAIRDVLDGAGVAVEETRVPRGAPLTPAFDSSGLPDRRWPRDVLIPMAGSAVLVVALALRLARGGQASALSNSLGLLAATAGILLWGAVHWGRR